MTSLTKHILVRYLTLRQAPLLAEAAPLHAALHTEAPGLHRALLRDPRAHPSHKAQALLGALSAPDYAHEPLLADLWALPTLEGLQVVDGLRIDRLNGRRARTLGLRFLLGHPRVAALALGRRKRTLRLLKHFLGERTWSAAARALRQPSARGERFLQQTLLRYPQAPQALHALCVLARAPAATLHVDVSPVGEAKAPGPLTALHQEALAQVPSAQQVEQLEAALDAVERSASLVHARVAVVLDLSASMASSGERSMHPAALGLALTRLLEARCAQVAVHATGGAGDYAAAVFPRPRGVADLASGLIEAARGAPDVVFVVTDGYESPRPGDAGEVLRGLRQLDWTAPVYQVVPRFTAREDLSRRTLSEAIPLLAVEHEDALPELLARAHVAALSTPIPARALERLGEILTVGA